MRRTEVLLVASIAAMVLGEVERVAGEEKAVSARVVEYFGYTGCIALENANARVVLCPQSGGRVLEYSWQGKNALYLDPSQKGLVYKEGQPPVDPCGGRFDIGPEMVIPRHPDVWLGEWSGQIVGPARSSVRQRPG